MRLPEGPQGIPEIVLGAGQSRFTDEFTGGSAKPVTKIFEPEAHENNRKPENLSFARFGYNAKLVHR